MNENKGSFTLVQRYEEVTVALDYERSLTSKILRGEGVRDLAEAQASTNASLRALYSDLPIETSQTFDDWYEATFAGQYHLDGDSDLCDGNAFTKFDLKLAFHHGALGILNADDDAEQAYRDECNCVRLELRPAGVHESWCGDTSHPDADNRSMT